MSQILLRADLNSLRPADEQAAANLRKFKLGTFVRADIARVRSPQQLRLWWALITLIHGQQDEWPTVESLSKAILCAIGHGTVERNKSGTMQTLKAKSIAFGNLKQDEFNEIFDRAIRLVCEKILPGVESDALKSEVLDMVGEKPGRMAERTI